jgi:hypothetical protein
MRWKHEPRRWKTCFAFFPVLIGDNWIWLERYRRRQAAPGDYAPYEYSLYAE